MRHRALDRARHDPLLTPALSAHARLADARARPPAVADKVLDAYAPAVGADPDVDRMLRLLKERVEGEVRLQLSLLKLQGSLEPILAASMDRGL